MKFEQHVFLSDVHLGAFSAETNQHIEEDLVALIKYCRENQIALYILGDLFDYWMEYPEKGFVPKLGKSVLDAFEDYNQTVSPALYITGNHDNWTFGHFEERGFDIEHNFRLTEIDNKRFLLMHGDGVISENIDFPTPVFHRVLRNPKFVYTYQKILPPKHGIATMKLFSFLTRKRTNYNPEPLNKQAERIFNNHNLDYIITGHDHVPRTETFSRGCYINLGTFFKHRTAALYNKNGLQLVKWKTVAKNFLPFKANNSTQ